MFRYQNARTFDLGRWVYFPRSSDADGLEKLVAKSPRENRWFSTAGKRAGNVLSSGDVYIFVNSNDVPVVCVTTFGEDKLQDIRGCESSGAVEPQFRPAVFELIHADQNLAAQSLRVLQDKIVAGVEPLTEQDKIMAQTFLPPESSLRKAAEGEAVFGGRAPVGGLGSFGRASRASAGSSGSNPRANSAGKADAREQKRYDKIIKEHKFDEEDDLKGQKDKKKAKKEEKENKKKRGASEREVAREQSNDTGNIPQDGEYLRVLEGMVREELLLASDHIKAIVRSIEHFDGVLNESIVSQIEEFWRANNIPVDEKCREIFDKVMKSKKVKKASPLEDFVASVPKEVVEMQPDKSVKPAPRYKVKRLTISGGRVKIKNGHLSQHKGGR